MSDFTKWTCDECRERLYSHQLLRAKNPFNPDEDISGCPECKSIDRFTNACEEMDCWRDATCGTPFGKSGYKRHCHEHPPTEQKSVDYKRLP